MLGIIIEVHGASVADIELLACLARTELARPVTVAIDLILGVPDFRESALVDVALVKYL